MTSKLIKNDDVPIVKEMDDDEWASFEYWSDVMRSYKEGEMPMAHGWPKEFPELLGRVAAYAAEKHHWKARKGTQVPYLSHLFAVSSLVMELGGTPDETLAALLHDVIEDTGTTPKELSDAFKEQIASIVCDCSDALTDQQKHLPWEVRKEKTINKIAKIPISSLKVILADKLHNSRCIVRDLGISSEQVWGRFGAPPEKVAWYYCALAKAIDERKNEGSEVFHAYVAELARNASFIRGAAAQLTGQ
jgi:(p)ppGpp synthase/HD superfamily hydrolase